MASPHQVLPIESVFAENALPILHDMSQTVSHDRDLIDVKHLQPAEDMLARIATDTIRQSDSSVLMTEGSPAYDQEYWTAARSLQIAKVTYSIARHAAPVDAVMQVVPEIADDELPAYCASLQAALPDFVTNNHTVNQLAWTFSHDAAPTHRYIPLAREIVMFGMLALERNYLLERTVAAEGVLSDADMQLLLSGNPSD